MICFHKWKYGEKYSVKMKHYSMWRRTDDPIKYIEHRQDKTCSKCGKTITLKVPIVDSTGLIA